MRAFSIFVLSLITTICLCQDNIQIGQWDDAVSFSQSKYVELGNNKVYCAASNGLFYYDQLDGSVNRITKVQGLSGIGITALKYNYGNDELYIGYRDGDIDILKGSTVYNMPDIKISNLVGSKRINEFYIVSNGLYIGTDYGISLIDIKNREVTESYYMTNEKNISVKDLVIFNANLYAASDSGLYIAALNSSTIINPKYWVKDTSFSYADSNISQIEFFNSTLFVNFKSDNYNSDIVFIKNSDETWTQFNGFPSSGIKSIKVNNNLITFALNYTVYVFNTSLSQTNIVWFLREGEALQPQQAIIDSGDSIWIADKNDGLLRYSGEFKFATLTPNSAPNNDAFNITIKGDNVYVSCGGVHGEISTNTYSTNGLFQYKSGEWTNLKNLSGSPFDTIFDILQTIEDPADPTKLYAASYRNGLVEIKDEAVKTIYNNTNSAISKVVTTSTTWYWVGTSAVAFDTDQNLWTVSSMVDSAIVVKTKSNKWFKYSISSVLITPRIVKLMIDKNGYKWYVAPKNGLIVFDHNNTFSDATDDNIKLLSFSDGKGSIPGSLVNCIVEDIDGQIWVGTNEGIGVFYTPADVFNEDINAEQIFIEQDGYTQYLFETESIIDIAIDGANRKWIATANAGVFLVSEDGTEEILHFDKDNSPLFSNHIMSIAINHNSGEVYIGTDEGILIYRSDATLAKYNFNDATVFPNPVTSDYQGLIAIKNLYANSEVKITDVAGNLVYETFAKGGTATWNGKNMDNQRVASGVYLVFSATPSGAESNVSKILFLN